MNLSLGFPEFSQELAVPTKPSLEAVVSRFEAARQEPDSAVRAIHHQPAAEGVYAVMPAAVDARLRAALEERGVARLYARQADAWPVGKSGPVFRLEDGHAQGRAGDHLQRELGAAATGFERGAYRPTGSFPETCRFPYKRLKVLSL